MDTDCIDIILASYNGEDYIEEQIRSIQAQTYDNWRLFVSDDGSTDDTLYLVERMSQKDKRICILRADRINQSPTWNFLGALQVSDAPYFAFCDQDDIWLPEKLEHELTVMSEWESKRMQPTPGLVYSDMIVVDRVLNKIDSSMLDASGKFGIEPTVRNLLNTNVVAGTTLLGNAPLRELVLGGLNENGEKPFVQMHDWWLAQIAVTCGFVAFLDECTVLYRQHGDNAVGAERRSLPMKIKNYMINRRRFWDNVRQAQNLETIYGDFMNNEDKKIVEAFASVGSNGPVASIKTIVDNKLFKHGLLEMVSQMATVILFRRK